MFIAPFYTPEFLAGYGSGSFNGALWTIAVEIQFYMLMPLLFWLFQRNNFLVTCVFTIFLGLNFINNFFENEGAFEKLYFISFFPWFVMFMFGAFVAKNESILNKINKIPFIFSLISYIFVWWVSSENGLNWGNKINFFGYFFLSAIIVKLSFLYPTLSQKVLKNNDISYGIYIFHMPIVNLALYYEYGGFSSSILVLSAVVLISLVSWFIVERPMLRLKKSTISAR